MNKVKTLTSREITIAERAAGNISIEVLETPGAAGKMLMLSACAWVIAKREDAQASFDSWQDKTPNELLEFLGLNEEEDADPKA